MTRTLTPLDSPVKPPVPPHTIPTTEHPTIDLRLTAGVDICHPGYPDIYNALLHFPALEDGGVDFDMVYHACCILVGNCWDSDEDASRCRPTPQQASTTVASARPPDAKQDDTRWSSTSQASVQPPAVGLHFPQQDTEPLTTTLTSYLSKSVTPGEKVVTRPLNGILPEGTYYFHVPAHPSPYPITPTFSHWVFPEKIPYPWRLIKISPIPAYKQLLIPSTTDESTVIRDECCRITQSFCGLEQAHIVPKAEDTWFMNNKMQRFSSNPSYVPPIDEMSNKILLRADVHRVFDRRELVMIPKLEDGEYKLVTYILHTKRQFVFEQHGLFHNRRCHDLFGISREFLFARFAWSIFNNMTIRLLDTRYASIRLRVRRLIDNGRSVGFSDITITSLSQIPSFPPTAGRRAASAAGSKRSMDDMNDASELYFDIAERRAYPCHDRSTDDSDWYFDVSKGKMCRYGKEDEAYSSDTDGRDTRRSRKRRCSDGMDTDSLPPLSRSIISVESNERSEHASDNVSNDGSDGKDGLSLHSARFSMPRDMLV
ncbi:hypothetical protein F5Y04DRAFT_262940 [Hypomontagnella monticulosa]|nr:hypothetical protein F5Y04DRAFT_262940 [Hypomontagnella monticulosa]